jgi:hypothetical protein
MALIDDATSSVGYLERRGFFDRLRDVLAGLADDGLVPFDLVPINAQVHVWNAWHWVVAKKTEHDAHGPVHFLYLREVGKSSIDRYEADPGEAFTVAEPF